LHCSQLGRTQNKIEVSCNLFKGSTSGTLQTDIIHKVFYDLKKDLNLNNLKIEDCKSFLKILLYNLVYNNNETNFYEPYEENNINEYLFLFLRKIRPKREVRQFLHVPYLLKNAKTQRRMIRFALAFNQLIKSNFYNNKFKNSVELEIITLSEEKVHAELKLMNSSILKANQQINITEFDTKRIYVVPSRKLCSLCLGAFQSFNMFEKKLNIKFIYPFSEKMQDIYDFKFPDFMQKNSSNDSIYIQIGKSLKTLSNNADSIRKKEKDNENFVPNTDSHKYKSTHKNKSKSSEKEMNLLSSDKVGESFKQGSQFTFNSILKSEGLKGFEVVGSIGNNLFNSVKNFFQNNNEDDDLIIEKKKIIAKNFHNFFNDFFKD